MSPRVSSENRVPAMWQPTTWRPGLAKPWMKSALDLQFLISWGNVCSGYNDNIQYTLHNMYIYILYYIVTCLNWIRIFLLQYLHNSIGHL